MQSANWSWLFCKLWFSAEARDQLDLAAYILMETLEFLCANPMLQMFDALDLLRGVATDVLGVDLELRHVSNIRRIFGIPVVGDLLGIFVMTTG